MQDNRTLFLVYNDDLQSGFLNFFMLKLCVNMEEFITE